MKYFVLFMAAMAATVFWPSVVAADDTHHCEAPESTAVTSDASQPVGAAGMMVFVDPATGRVTGTPTAEQRAAMQARIAGLFDQSDDGTYDEILPNGAVLRDLQGRLMNATVVRIAADGSKHQECTTRPIEVLSTEVQPKTDTASSAGAVK